MSVDENGIVVDKQGKGIFEEFWHSSLRGHLRRGTIEKRLAILEERNDKVSMIISCSHMNSVHCMHENNAI